MKLWTIYIFIADAIIAYNNEQPRNENVITRRLQLQDKMHDKGENYLCSVTTRTGENIGLCVPIVQCEVLFNMTCEVEKRPNIQNLLHSLKCNEKDKSYVCCPYSSVKPGRSRRDNYPSLLSPPNCGKPPMLNTRIIGGINAQKGAWPWAVALGYRTFANPETSWFCGGTLISNQYILTAAHCLKPRHPEYILHRVQLGSIDLTNDIEGTGVAIDAVITHPNYTFSESAHDIGIIKLKSPIIFTDNIQPICLPKIDEFQTENFLGYNPFVIGWGVADYATGRKSVKQLLQTQIPIVGNEYCNKSYTRKNKIISHSQICTYDKNNEKDSCLGDSGGPLMISHKNSYYVIGIVSFGYKCGEPGYPGVYSRVTSYLNWIATVIS